MGEWSRYKVRRSMLRWLLCVLLALVVGLEKPLAKADPGPVYQRSRHSSYGNYAGWQHHRGNPYPHAAQGHFVPQQQHAVGSHYQRPYPYHLDYYRMRYGGSYAPYFGNLYGTPQVYAPGNFYGGHFGPPYGYPMGYGMGAYGPMGLEQAPPPAAPEAQ